MQPVFIQLVRPAYSLSGRERILVGSNKSPGLNVNDMHSNPSITWSRPLRGNTRTLVNGPMFLLASGGTVSDSVAAATMFKTRRNLHG